jgi:excisionase family DNA binding protein
MSLAPAFYLSQISLRVKAQRFVLETIVTEAIDELLNAEEAAPLLHCHHRTLLRKAREGLVPCVHVFGKVLFSRSRLNEWIATQVYNPSAVRAA